ncbi:glycosyltransferase [Dyadobacter sp. CY323]|uniref:glycosyltransferase n=1 Tax=Dyadobacter sp. CY323 TaxID=2907302 RepID=UPI001F3ADE2B|nr:glycosyltransferase [Dyadobacter sp. CY323]MCE6990059.1 glycosyltransferase [Dyadobacter sp. CY323]
MKPNTLQLEIAWEVCNQIGGIFTYIKSRVPTMVDTYGEEYMLIGPYFPEKAKLDFRPIRELDDSPLSQAIQHTRNLGFEVHYGYWLLEEARPKVLLINPVLRKEHSDSIKARLWNQHGISTIQPDPLTDQVIAFGEITRILLTELIDRIHFEQDVIAHYHEWMSAVSLIGLVAEKVRVATIFTAHATLIGRYVAPNEQQYHLNLHEIDWRQKASDFQIEDRVGIERTAAKSAHVLITSSSVTARECEAFLDRSPDSIISAGIHRKPGVGHEVFEKHLQNRSKIDAFVKALFSPSYQFKTEKTLYFFTSGRYEFQNKGFDITLAAVSRLNEALKRNGSDITVVFFLISKKPFYNIRTEVLEARQRYQNLQKICKQISARIGPRIYSNVTGPGGRKLPDLNQLMDDELHHTWRQAVNQFKRDGLPPVTTHHLHNDDEVTRELQRAGLNNKEEDRVKVIYHPDFMDRATSLFSMDYLDFVRGCHLGIFPSLYEPWGYAPMETVMHGTPVISSDLSGFGKFIGDAVTADQDHEIAIINRRYQSDESAAAQLTSVLEDFVFSFENHQYIPRARLSRQVLDRLCWTELQLRYQECYRLALIRYQPVANLY